MLTNITKTVAIVVMLIVHIVGVTAWLVTLQADLKYGLAANNSQTQTVLQHTITIYESMKERINSMEKRCGC